MKKEGLLVFILVIFIFLISFVSAQCSDSDGENYNVKGVVEINGDSFVDKCGIVIIKTSENLEIGNLIEYVCDEGELGTKGYKCENGCEGGICIFEKGFFDNIRYLYKELVVLIIFLLIIILLIIIIRKIKLKRIVKSKKCKKDSDKKERKIRVRKRVRKIRRDE